MSVKVARVAADLAGVADTRWDATGGPFDRVLAAAQASDALAWSQLFRTYAPAIAGYLRAQGCRDVDDVASEVFLSILKAIGAFAGDEAAFRSWVFVIAHRRLTDERRRTHRRPQQTTFESSNEVAARGDVEDDAGQRAGTARAVEMCERLSADQRDVILLRVVADLSLEDVARVLSKSVGAVKALQHRGLATLERTFPHEAVSQ